MKKISTPIKTKIDENVTFGRSQMRVSLTPHAASSFFSVAILGWVCIRFRLNAAYLILFALSFLIVFSAWMAYFNLKKIVFFLDAPMNAFQDDLFSYDITFLAPRSGGWRHGIQISQGGLCQSIDLEPGKKTRLSVKACGRRRGRGGDPTFLIQTTQPFGLWKVGVSWQPEVHHWIYPKPSANASSFPADPSEDAGTNLTHHDQGVVDGLKNYVAGESMRRIDWRSWAKTDGRIMLTKKTSAHQPKSIWITETRARMFEANREDMLCRMTRWVLDADSSGSRYGLSIGEKNIDPSNGKDHLEKCLIALASYDEKN